MGFNRGGQRGGGRGGGFRGNNSFRGGRDGNFNSGPPSKMEILGSVQHTCDRDLVCKNLHSKIPYFNAFLYLENKTEIGKVDEILGKINDSWFSVKLNAGIEQSTIPKDTKLYIDPYKLLPVERFLPPPPSDVPKKKKKKSKSGDGNTNNFGSNGDRGNRRFSGDRGRGGGRGGRGGNRGSFDRGGGGGGRGFGRGNFRGVKRSFSDRDNSGFKKFRSDQ